MGLFRVWILVIASIAGTTSKPAEHSSNRLVRGRGAKQWACSVQESHRMKRCGERQRLPFPVLVLEIVKGDVVLADHLGDVPSGFEFEFPIAGPHARVSLGIVNGDIYAQLIVLGPGDSFDNVQLVGMRKAPRDRSRSCR
jgi:hypothetical protein